jgi:hypothetical protein
VEHHRTFWLNLLKTVCMATSIPYSVPFPQFSLANDMGANAPVYHQRTIARLVTGLTIEYRADKQPYEPLPEMMVGEYSSPTPDVVLYDNATETLPSSLKYAKHEV